MTSVDLSVLIMIEMLEVFCYTLGKIHHQNLTRENKIELFFVEIIYVIKNG